MMNIQALRWKKCRYLVCLSSVHIVYEILYGPINVSVSDHTTYVKTNDGTSVHLLADLDPAATYRVAVRAGNTFLGVYGEAAIKNIVTGYPCE